MDWKAIRAEYTELGQTFVVAKPAVVIELYGQGSRIAPHGEALLDLFLGILPEKTQLYVLGNNDRQYKPLTPQSMRRLRQTLKDLDKRGRFYSIKDAPEFNVGQFSLEIHLGSDHAMRADAVQIALPIGWGDSGDAERVVELFGKYIGAAPFWAGVAGYGFDLVWGREFEQRGMPVNFQLSKRLHGVLIRDRLQEIYLVKKLKSAGWLTYLDAELVEKVGGEAALKTAVGEAVSVASLGAGLLLRTGPTPPVGDVNRQDKDVEPLAAVNRAIKNIRLEHWLSTNLFNADFKPDRENADAWLTRFD
jgi:hypothetical protein